VARSFTDKLRMLAGGFAAGAMSLALIAEAAQAQGHPAPRSVVGEEYTPTIWVDPDGCEHWVMDDGFEGYMAPRRTRDGRPVCRRSQICGVIPSDQLFKTDKSNINENGRKQLDEFFKTANAFGFLIYGHTDARASDEYNIALSDRRADAVADIARAAGVRVVDVKGFGERQPRASGSSPEALQQNRRVEIYCVR